MALAEATYTTASNLFIYVIVDNLISYRFILLPTLSYLKNLVFDYFHGILLYLFIYSFIYLFHFGLVIWHVQISCCRVAS